MVSAPWEELLVEGSGATIPYPRSVRRELKVAEEAEEAVDGAGGGCDFVMVEEEEKEEVIGKEVPLPCFDSAAAVAAAVAAASISLTSNTGVFLSDEDESSPNLGVKASERVKKL